MGKTVDMKPDKYKQLIAKQNKPVRPETLGEPGNVTNWEIHIKEGHAVKNFTKIQTTKVDPVTKKETKEAFMSTPGAGQRFIAVKEQFCGYYYIWILCVKEGTNHILYRANSGDIDFVTWDIPEKK